MNWKQTKHEKPQQHERVLCWSPWQLTSLATYQGDQFHDDGANEVFPERWLSVELPRDAGMSAEELGIPSLIQRMQRALDSETPESLARKLQSYGMEFKNPPPPLKEGETDD